MSSSQKVKEEPTYLGGVKGREGGREEERKKTYPRERKREKPTL